MPWGPRPWYVQAGIALESAIPGRPGLDLLGEVGREGERKKFKDIVRTFGERDVAYDVKDGDYKPFDLLSELGEANPRRMVIEAEFAFPEALFPELAALISVYGLVLSRLRPDIVRRMRSQKSSPTHEVSRQDRIQPATLIRVRVCKRVRRVHALAQGTQAQSMTTGCPVKGVTRCFHATS